MKRKPVYFGTKKRIISCANGLYGRLKSTREGKRQESTIHGWLLDHLRVMKPQTPECAHRNTNPSGPASAGLFVCPTLQPRGYRMN
jgi:hypothetical protein